MFIKDIRYSYIFCNFLRMHVPGSFLEQLFLLNSLRAGLALRVIVTYYYFMQ